MSQVDAALSGLRRHPGVERLLLVGSDGLLVRQVGEDAGGEAETLAAMLPGLASACGAVAEAAGRGEFSTAVVEMTGGVAIVAALSPELLLAVLLRRDVGFSALLRELRTERGRLAALL